MLRHAIFLLLMLAPPPPAMAQTPAEAYPKPATQTFPDAPTPLTQARSLLAAENYAVADQLLRELIQQQPGSPERHFLLAFTLLHENNPKAALEEYALAAKLRPWGPEELTGVASAQMQLKDYTAAETAAAEAVKQAPLRPFLWYLLGRAQYAQGHFTDAEKSLLTSLRLNPQQSRAESALGLVYEATNRPESAITAYRAAIALQATSTKEPKELQPCLSLGILLRRQGKAAEALPLLQTAAGMNQRNSLVQQELGLVEEQLGHYEEALAAMKTAASLTPQVAELHFFLGRLYRKTGRPDQATAEFVTAAKLSKGTNSPGGG